MTDRALSFGAAAAEYERFRPGYPDRLVDLVRAHAEGPVATALEIGAGTGKATRVFAHAGIVVTATDPDEAMLAQLCEQCPRTVRVVRGALEDLPPLGLFDLVYAAASLHWTDPGTRFTRIAALVRPGGVFASFGGPVRLADAELRGEVAAAMRPVLEDDSAPRQATTPGNGQLGWPGTELAASPLFTDVVEEVISQREWVSADHYLGQLSTVSAYLMLSQSDRDDVFQRIRAVLPDPVEISRDLSTHLARRSAT